MLTSLPMPRPALLVDAVAHSHRSTATGAAQAWPWERIRLATMFMLTMLALWLAAGRLVQ